jgi:hypothetical protein
MQGMQRGEGFGGNTGAAPAGFSTVLAIVLALGLVAAAGGCSSISTPLPDIGATGSTTMSAKDSEEAAKELARKGDTHQQDAEKEIEQSR